MSTHFWIAAHPDVERAIGGIKQIHRLAEAIRSCGYPSTLIQENAGFHPQWFHSSVDTISFADWLSICERLDKSNNILIIPETFVGGFLDYPSSLPIIVFNQNSAYTFDAPANKKYHPNYIRELYNHPRVLHVLCVSQHDHDFLSLFANLGPNRISRIINCIESDFCMVSDSVNFQLAYMPRKHKLHAEVVLQLLSSQNWFDQWSIVCIENSTQCEVIKSLQASSLFLSFGFPEGFGLPVAEAMACGCAVIGYSGLGGRELFERAQLLDMAHEVPFGDFRGFIDAAHDFHRSNEQQSSTVLSRLKALSLSVSSHYNFSNFLASVDIFLRKLH